MTVNIVLLCVGLFICFGGIYLKKVFAACTGVSWGAVIGFVVALFAAGSINQVGETALTMIAAFALIIAVLSAVFDRLFTSISSFFETLSAVMVAFAISGMKYGFRGCLAIAVVEALITACIHYLLYHYVFIVLTSLIGSFLTSLGGYGLIQSVTPGKILTSFIWGNLWGNLGNLWYIPAGTVVLGVVGCVVQIRRHRKRKKKKTAKKERVQQQYSLWEQQENADWFERLSQEEASATMEQSVAGFLNEKK